MIKKMRTICYILVVIADRVKGLVIKGNTITKNNDAPSLFPKAPIFELINCVNTKIEHNTYEGDCKNTFELDERSKTSLTENNNKGFNIFIY